VALQTVIVCDVCGQPASQTVGLKVAGRSLTKDVCDGHLHELTAGARQARRGRPRVRPDKNAHRSVLKKASASRKATVSTKRRRRSKAGAAAQEGSETRS
jgi:hypothetical protein